MAKKNDKNRKKRYIEWLKETESNIRNKKDQNATKIQNAVESETDCAVSKLGDVCMSVKKVKKKNIKLDRKGKRRLNKLSGKFLVNSFSPESLKLSFAFRIILSNHVGIKRNNTSMNL